MTYHRTIIGVASPKMAEHLEAYQATANRQASRWVDKLIAGYLREVKREPAPSPWAGRTQRLSP